MTARHDRLQAKARQVRRLAALARPEILRKDGFARGFSSAPIGPPIKQQDPAIRRLVEAALAKKKPEGPSPP